MKRSLHALLVALLVFSALDGVAAKKPKKEKLVTKFSSKELYSEEKEEEREREKERAREQRMRRTARADEQRKSVGSETSGNGKKDKKDIAIGPPVERRLTKSKGKVFDLRALPTVRPRQRERPEHEGPDPLPMVIEGEYRELSRTPRGPVTEAAAPAPILTFDGLDRENWGSGSPPDTTGDVGPDYYIQSVNSSVGIYRKSDGFREAAFTFDTLMAQGNFGNQCDTENFGDPVILYDTFEDRWVLTDFAFTLDGTAAVNPPVAYQCFAVSMSGDPISGGWNFYSIEVTDGLNDYPKLGVWSDGIYMSANMFTYASSSSFIGARVWALNKAQMYAGSPTVQIVSFDIGAGDFTVIPSNARLQTGTPPPGTPNYFLSTWNYLNGVSVYKFHADWNSVPLSTFTGPDVPLASSSWPNAGVANIPQPGTTTALDALHIRAMVQNQYTNFGGTESLWVPHTVRRANTTGFAAPRWYQVNVSGGTVNASIPQAMTWDPDGANVLHRWMPSLAIDRAGNLALGYSASSATVFPSIMYAGRLASDPINTFSQTEQTLFAGTHSQTGSSRWGDYSSMMLDPDGCTFWFTTQYANSDQAFDKRWKTKVGTFRYPECTMVGDGGTISGTVTFTPSGDPVDGALVELGSRSTVTDASGAYSFDNIPAGTYPSMTASLPGYVSNSATSIVVTDAGTTTQNFTLAVAPTNGCDVDTTKADFQNGLPTQLDLTGSPGDVKLLRAPTVDQQNQTLGTQGAGFNTVTWLGQTFTAAVSGPVVRIDLNLFSLNCGAVTMPNLTVSIRNAATNLPTGADLGTATIPGFCNGAGGWFTADFSASPVTLVAGTQYAIVWRAAAAIPAGAPAPGYFGTVSAASGLATVQNPYAGGRRTSSSNGGSTWAGAAGNANNDHGFIVYMDLGYKPTGNLISGTTDSNPADGLTPIWSTLSWNGTAPTNTTLRFQAAGSNDVNGPFSFVGPDGTAATYFTSSSASLAQFYDLRYLRYKAYLTTSDGSVTPTVNDVTVCYSNEDCSGVSVPITPTEAKVCPSSSGNSATGPAGATSYAWSISNGTIQGSTTSQTVSYTAGASGTVALTLQITVASGCHGSNAINVPIGVPATPTITPDGVTTFCQGDSVTLTSSSATGNQWYDGATLLSGEMNQTYVATTSGNYNVVVNAVGGCSSAPSSSVAVTVNPTPSTPTITPGGPTTFCGGDSVLLTSSSATGNQWFNGATLLAGETNQTYTAIATGNYHVVVTQSGCPSDASSSVSVTVNAVPSTPTATPDGPTTFCQGGDVTLTSSSASGNQWFDGATLLAGETNASLVVSSTGNYHVVVTANGCASSASSSVAVTVHPTPNTPSITPGGATTFCAGGNVTLTSSVASGYQWSLNGTPIGGATSQQYVASASGDYTVTVTENGCASSASTATNVTVNPLPSTPTITPGGPTTFCTGGNVTLTSSSATGNQWYLDGSPIGGATAQQYIANATGSYTVVITDSQTCSSAPSSATSVTVNAIPSTPTITPDGPTTFCAGGNVTLTSSSASGNQWFLNGSPIGGATTQQYIANATGNYTVVVTTSGCASSPSSSTSVTVNPAPSTPTITPGGPTTFCTGGSVTLTSSSASGNQWFLNGSPIGGATAQQYVASATGNYTVAVTASGCTSAPSSATSVTVNAIPSTPTITPDGPTTFCTGDNVTLTSSSASGNQWFLNGSPIGGATAQQFVASATGNYTVAVTASGCTSAPSSATTVTVNSTPSTPTITPNGATTFCAGGSVTLTSSSASGNQWFLNGNPIGSATSQQFVATATGNYTVVVTNSGCASSPSSATSVTVNPAPSTPTITPNGPTTFCTGGSVTLTSSSASGNQWFLNGNPIGSATAQQFVANATGNYTVAVTASGCTSAPSSATTVTVNSTPSTPTITPNGATTFCAGGSVTLTSSSASGNQWFLNGNPIGSATAQQFVANATGNYTVVVTNSGCASAPSSATAVTVNPVPSTPTITPNGPTSFCTGGSVTLTSSSASGNQWLLNGSPIGGATNQTFVASATGDYSVTASASGCTSNASAATTVTVNPIPSATITAPASLLPGASGNASVPNAGVGAIYVWGITNGSFVGAANGPNVNFTAGSAGTLALTVTVTSGASCSNSGNANVTVTSAPVTVTVNNVTPGSGSSLGGRPVTITGTGFASGATVTFGGNAATVVVVVNATTITALTPAHAVGAVNVTVTNADTSTGTLNNGYTYIAQQFDANGDGDVDPADIFYIVNYLFLDGPAPSAMTPGRVTTEAGRLTGSVTLGTPVVRDGRTFIPVIVATPSESLEAQALSLRLRVTGDATIAAIRRAGTNVQPAFEITRAMTGGAAYLVAASGNLSGVVAEIELTRASEGMVRVDVDPALTLLTRGGVQQATVAGRTLQVRGVTLNPTFDRRPETRERN